VRRAAVLALLSLAMSGGAFAADPLSGATLYADVERYDSFGIHRYGSPGLDKALDWIARELKQAGLAVSSQPFSLHRQYDFESATLIVDGQQRAVVPQWWIPDRQASFALIAPIASDGDTPAPDAFVRARLPFDRGAYLNAGHRVAIEKALAREPRAVLLTIDHPSGDIFTYNVAQTDRAWSVPVILVAPKDSALLESAQRSHQPVSLAVQGAMRRDVPGRNVVARLDRGKGKWIVVSTPVSSWFTSTCERAPGIATFLALAQLATQRWPQADFVFVATSGHEIGHGGMEHFLRDGAPRPDATLAWVHLGASLACSTDNQRLILASDAMAADVAVRFKDISGQKLVGAQAGVGELREVQAAGYPRFFGLAGYHRYFHTPADRAALTSPELLEPVARSFVETIEDTLAPTR
jgi:hypothetical protein